MIGKTVIYSDSLPVTVAGIVKDWNKLTDLGYTDFISISTAPNSWLRSRIPTADWRSLRPHRSQAFVKLAPGTTPAQVNAALNKFIHQHHILFGPTKNAYPRYYLQPLSAIHYTPDFHPTDSGDDFRKAYLPMLYALMGVAVFILVLAVINFINLSTAQSLQRMKEVGIRKVMGSSRKGLILQFLVETLLMTGTAVLLSLLLVRPVLAAFSQYIPRGVAFHLWDGGTLLFLLAITLVTTLVAGYYPARLLSSYLPVLSLKGSLDRAGTGGAALRKTLIVFQFAISLVFIIGSLVIARQIQVYARFG
jgi:putative ABC transport system permease protein